jgi:F0F1-type ATP synthase membrane subunit c/vacuolar-type H+-ATPase subunit K
LILIEVFYFALGYHAGKKEAMEELKNAYRRTAIIGIAMIATLAIYILVVVLIQATRESFESPADASLVRNIFLFISLVTIFLIQIFRSRMFRTPSVAGAGEKPSEKDLVQKLVSASVVIFALAESIAIFGLVLFFLTNRATDFYMFLAISLISFTLFFPRYLQWEEWMKRRTMGHPTS